MFASLPWMPPPAFDPDDTGTECSGGATFRRYTIRQYMAEKGVSYRAAASALLQGRKVYNSPMWDVRIR